VTEIDFEAKEFAGLAYGACDLEKGNYETCAFRDCNFGEADLSNFSFTECEFENCDFSNAVVTNLALKDVNFKNCKLLGLLFYECRQFLFSARFEECRLNLSSFYKMGLTSTRFHKCDLREVDFSGTDLANSHFSECNLAATIFENTVLEKVDLRSSFNFSIDPERNRITGAQFSAVNVVGLLDKYNIVVD